MRPKQFVQDDDAVSPVIGVILMVAITVILAAIIAAFVMGLGPGSSTPTASFSFEENGSYVDVTHETGDSIPYDQLSIAGDADVNWDAGNASGTVDGESVVTSGDSKSVNVGNGSWTLSVVWTSADNSSSSELAEESG